MRRRPMRRGAKKTHDYCWVTTVIQQAVVDGGLAEIDLVSSGTWEANANNFERATLICIRGWLSTVQHVAATNSDETFLAMGIVKAGLTETLQFDPRLAAEYDINDVMWTWGQAMGEGTTNENPFITHSLPVNIKVKRKLSSADKITLVVAMSNDTTSVTAQLNGVLRCLVDRA